MITESITPDVVIIREAGERSVLVCGERYTTAIDLPARVEMLSAILNTSRDLTPEGLRSAILTHEPPEYCAHLGCITGVQVVRGDRTPGEDWEWDDVPPELLHMPDVPVHIVRHPQTVHDDSGRVFHVEPCLGGGSSLAVYVQPENMLVCCQDLDPLLPPRIQPGRVHEMVMRLEDWRLRLPSIIIPASGVPIRGDAVVAVLDRSIAYLRSLYQQTRVGLTETRVPWERLVYMMPATAMWPGEGATKPLMDRHRDNVRQMAEDIFQRVQGEAEELSIVSG